ERVRIVFNYKNGRFCAPRTICHFRIAFAELERKVKTVGALRLMDEASEGFNSADKHEIDFSLVSRSAQVISSPYTTHKFSSQTCV
ncbi:MAG TPA: hypothetical protein VGA10_09685, partial [Thermoanaerobaculia bacterium]